MITFYLCSLTYKLSNPLLALTPKPLSNLPKFLKLRKINFSFTQNLFNLTLKVIKRVLMPFTGDFPTLDASVKDLDASVKEFKASVKEFKASVKEFKASVKEFKDSVKEFKDSVKEFKDSVKLFDVYFVET